ncbi:DUF2514 domain-containing protein [Pseudomonas gingeri]|uniref:DUF2514 family protein n=1 Tax=Pseudomonas gingeri TaxID=117681 RepID=UPI0015A13232|nr:DUF2514 family protein [Pseudomonas gingeri]NWA24071.1 DUF2514 domain-containing protein [Pseudomonas gingeri]
MTLLGRIAPYLIVLALVAAALFGAYHHGETVRNDWWQAEWNKRDAADQAAKALNERAERDKEQARQNAINKVVENGQVFIDTATAAVAAANRESGRVRDAADDLANRLAASEAGRNSCTAAAGKAAAHAARVLADVFKRADERAGILAADADQSRARGMTCEAAYDSLVKLK